ncbi:alpha/beta fold hydrolase [Parapedobacter sp. 10938]|uniref:alpha/beta fold hydrolase n=1 Tax=Parapedobacter flavus TaxID=3110225 RepID=UPI002DBE6D1B|nr:alpha/beta hydrolase [Parapedobacter sp. 10938]MEC3879027.1 alpha/beta hydrolase [Parapedobacter sp. 10938]
MPVIQHQTASQTIGINYVDYGSGQPIILIHGWPLSHKAWEKQIPALVEAGYRVIAYDRRGFGQSDAPWEGYDYDALASDLHALITQLDLQQVNLVGFSMGGGEVIRYLTQYGADKINKIALVASIIPLVKQKPDNPAGVPEAALKDILAALLTDRLHFLSNFHPAFYNYKTDGEPVSEQQLIYDFSISSHAAPHATIGAAKAWMDTDFRTECKQVTVPTLIIHGKADETVPIATSAAQAASFIPNSKLVVYDDAPHGLNLTHADQLNGELIAFFKSFGQ